MPNVIERVTKFVGSHGVRMAYGDVATISGVEVLPVAIVSYAFGGGGDDADNGGGAGGATVVPIGIYFRDNKGVHFRPNLFALALASIPVVATAGWVTGRILKHLR